MLGPTPYLEPRYGNDVIKTLEQEYRPIENYAMPDLYTESVEDCGQCDVCILKAYISQKVLPNEPEGP